MLLIDYSPFVIRPVCAMAKTQIDINLIRHIVLSQILHLKQKFPNMDLLFAVDSNNTWRKEYFPYYKCKRKFSREKSNINWTELYNLMDTICDELSTVFNYNVIKVEHCEADDIIAVISQYTSDNIIISGDKDFKQLLSDSTRQYDIKEKKFIGTESDYLLHHIIHGDSADSIPNILSNDSCIANNTRQTPLTKKKLDYLLQTDISNWPEEYRNNYTRNDTLINFKNIPVHYRNNIIQYYNNYNKSSNRNLINYFIDNNLKLLLEDIQYF